MPFFKNLFGSQKPKQKPVKAPAPKPDSIQQKKVQTEAVIVNLENKIIDFEDKQKKFDTKINNLKEKAKEYLQEDRKKEAKKYLEEATRLQKQAEKYTLRKKALVDKKNALEEAMMNMETIGALESAQSHIKDQEKYNQQLETLVLDGQDAKMMSNELNDKMKDLVDHESEDEQADNMLNELMGEINKEKKKKIQASANVKVPASSQKQKSTEDDEIANMMANLT